jgi:iron complex transport system substrate-binding protein
MKNIILILTATLCLTSCGRFGHKEAKEGLAVRIVCISKQYNEIIFALGAQKNIVGVDLSSIYPPDVQKLPNVGYHRALSIEGILSLKPDLIIHDNNVGPESVMKQVGDLKIPIKTFSKDGDSIEGVKALIREMGIFFNAQHAADSLCNQLDSQMKAAIESAKQYTDTPRVAIIHFGRIGAGQYLVMTNHGTAARIIQWSGGRMAVEAEHGMAPLSAEILAKSDPDVILVTDFGFDKLGSADKVMELPGVAETKAAKNHRIFRVWEHDLVYLGPRTGEIVSNFQKLIHSDAPAQ